MLALDPEGGESLFDAADRVLAGRPRPRRRRRGARPSPRDPADRRSPPHDPDARSGGVAERGRRRGPRAVRVARRRRAPPGSQRPVPRIACRAAKFRPIVAHSPQAGVAQRVERRICNPQVKGSSPLASSTAWRASPASRAEGQRGVGFAARGGFVNVTLTQHNLRSLHVAGSDRRRGACALSTPFRRHFDGMAFEAQTRSRTSAAPLGEDAHEERYRSGQTGQTVNLLDHSFGGSNPPLSTKAPSAGPVGETGGGPRQSRPRNAARGNSSVG